LIAADGTSAISLAAASFFRHDLQQVAVELRHPQLSFPLHNHDFNEIAIVSGGHGWHEINQRTEVITCGDVLYIHANDVHRFHSVHNLCLVNVLYRTHFLEDHHPQLVQEITLRRNQVTGAIRWQISEVGLAAIRPLIERLRMESTRRDPCSLAMVDSLFTGLNVMLLRHEVAEEEAQDGGDPLCTVLKFIREHFAENLHVDEVATRFGYSSSNFNRKFKARVGMSPHTFLTQLRLIQAMHEIASTAASITEIGLRCGFRDSNYFSSTFTNFAGISPREYRKRNSATG